MSDFVLDASVALSLYLPASTAQKDYSAKVLTLIQNGAVPAVPFLWIQEVGSSLIKARRARGITLATFNRAVNELDSILYETHSIAYGIADLVRLAKAYNLQGYDAVYFDLAKRLGIPMASVDRGIRSACKNHAVTLL